MALPAFLVPEITIHANGAGPTFDLGDHRGGLLLTLGVTEVIEQELLLVTVSGSMDGADWGPAPLIEYSQKFYTGLSALFLDTARNPVRYLQAHWKTDRWGRGSKTPAFRFYLFAEAIDG